MKERLSRVMAYIRDAVHPDSRRRLVEILSRGYLEELGHRSQFLEHAQLMVYPQFRERLLRIADEEQEHIDWLRGRILELGGKVPSGGAKPASGQNSWERLLKDLEAERRCAADLIRILAEVEAIDPEIARGLERMWRRAKNHRNEITSMLMRSDPQAGVL